MSAALLAIGAFLLVGGVYQIAPAVFNARAVPPIVGLGTFLGGVVALVVGYRFR